MGLKVNWLKTSHDDVVSVVDEFLPSRSKHGNTDERNAWSTKVEE